LGVLNLYYALLVSIVVTIFYQLLLVIVMPDIYAFLVLNNRILTMVE